MKIMPLILLLALSCACLPNKDDNSPSWVGGNRLSLEQVVNCNESKDSLGISGCAFIGTPDEAAALTIPPVYHSRLVLTSTGCKVTEYRSPNKGVKIPLKEVYTNGKGQSCSFKISRYVHDPKDRRRLDQPQIGRFFIKIVPPNAYHRLAKFSINDSSFAGVGWYKRPYMSNPPLVTLYPTGTRGTFLMKCGDKDTLIQEYTASPFTITAPSDTCDYEIAMVNDDSPYIEFATLVVETEQYTEDIHLPLVSVKRSSIEFFFTDKNSKGKPSVVGVQIEDKVCPNTHKCSHPTRDTLTVKAVTANMRFFKGIYHSTTHKWEVIR